MKKSIFLLVIFIGLFCKQTYAMRNDESTVVRCRITGLESNGESIDSIKSILTQRLQHLDSRIIPFISYNESDSIYTVELPGIINQNIELLFAHGDVNIMEMYNPYEIYKIANSDLIDSLIVTYYIGGMERFSLNHSSNVLLLTPKENLPTIDSFINANYIDFRFPTDSKLSWRKAGINMGLCILRQSDNNLNINKVFSKSTIKLFPRPTLRYHAINDDDYFQMIDLNEEGTKQLEKLAKLNTAKPLAFCIDDQVLYTFQLNFPLEKGRILIEGSSFNLSKDGLALISSILYSPTIKSDIEVLDITIKEKSKE